MNDLIFSHFIFPSFATREPNGLLLYNGRFNEKHDFIAMEIINQQIQLTFSAGSAGKKERSLHHPKSSLILQYIYISFIFSCFFLGETKTTVSPYIVGGVSDGQWHEVEVRYYNKVPTRLALFCLFVFGSFLC